MKRIFGIVVSLSLLAAVCVAQEDSSRVLLDAAKLAEATYSSDKVQTDNDADKWYADFGSRAAGKSAKVHTLVKNAKERGIGLKIEFPNDSWNGKQESVILRPNILAELTENENGNGKITNVGDIKSVTIKGFSLQYDLSVRPVMKRSDGSRAGMSLQNVPRYYGDFEVKWDNPNYIADVNKRDIKIKPVYPNTSSDLLLEGIEVRGTVVDRYLIVYLSTISVVADKAYEELDSFSDELWGLEGRNADKIRLRQEKELEQRQLQVARQEALMAKSTEENTSQ